MSSNDTTAKSAGENDLLWGWPVKKLFKLALVICVSATILFVGLPFLLALIIPIFAKDPEKFKYLVDTLDGISLVLGLTGTVASIVSIIMTLADQKRFKHEKEQTASLIQSVNELHNQIRIVDNYVRKTFEKNQELSLQLYKANIIPKQSSGVDLSVSTGANDHSWENLCKANESPLEEEQNEVNNTGRKEEGE